MAVTITFNGITYSIPVTGDEVWGESVSSYLQAIATGALQKTGGNFTLTADVNWGANFGLRSTYYKSRAAFISSAGQVRLGNTETIGWRNAANDGNLLLSTNASDEFTFNNSINVTGDVTATGIVSGSIEISGLNPSETVVTDGSSNLTTIPYASANTASAIVRRDGSGNFSAGTLSLVGANLSGLSVSQAVVTDGSRNLASLAYASANTASALVQRDGSGNFSAGTLSLVGATLSGLTPTQVVLTDGSRNLVSGLITNSYLSGSAGITNANLATMADMRVKGNASGGAAVPSDLTLASTATASTVMYRDTNANTLFNNFGSAYATTVTAAGTTTLTVGSARQQYFTGTSAQTVRLPAANTLPATGFGFEIVNMSTQSITVQDNGGNTVQVMAASSTTKVIATNIGSANGVWNSLYTVLNAGGGTVTSVGLTVPATSIFGVTNSPITVTGDIDLTTSGTSGGIPYFSNANTLSSSAALTANQLIVGGGAGAAPVTLAAGSQYQSLVMGAANPGWGAVNLAQAAAITGTLPVGNGGTGTTTSTGTGSVVLSDSPTFTGTVTVAALTASGTVNLSGLTASTALALDGSKNVVSVTNTGSGNNVLSASPTFTGTITAAAITMSGILTVSSGSSDGQIRHGGTAGRLIIDGDSGGAGAEIKLYGSTHATLASNLITAANVHTFQTTGGTTRLGISSSGVVSMPANVASTSTTTGTLVITGGLGVSGNASIPTVTAGTSGQAIVLGDSPGSVPSNDIKGYVVWGASATFGGNNGDVIYIPRSSSACDHRFYAGSTSPVERLKTTSAGALVVGVANVPDVLHQIQNSSTSNQTLDLRNKNTTTSSDGIQALTITKGSTTNTAGNNNFILFQINDGGTTSGKISTNGASQAAFFSASDRRLKTDIQPMSGSLEKICALNPVNFKWKKFDERKNGFIAQELAEIMPELVSKTDDGSGDEVPEGVEAWNMTDSGMIPYLVSAIKELKKQIDELRG